MNKIIKKISEAVQFILLAPIKLPAKVLNIIKYVAVGLGVLEAVTREEVTGDENKEVQTSGNSDNESSNL